MISLTNNFRVAFILHLVFSIFLSAKASAGVRVFPQIEETQDTEDILDTYPDYLRFALAVAKQVEPKAADRLHRNYQKLIKYDPTAAARFLKSLRFEMDHKVGLMGKAPSQVTTQSPEIRRWVRRFAGEWAREADEHLFRAIAMRAQERNRSSEN